jgi:hypothetical protein
LAKHPRHVLPPRASLKAGIECVLTMATMIA